MIRDKIEGEKNTVGGLEGRRLGLEDWGEKIWGGTFLSQPQN
jgi:hypothetical protein